MDRPVPQEPWWFQQKLDGLEGWHFHLVIESLPAMLQFPLLLPCCALSRYLWTISRTVAEFILAFTLFGVTSYGFFTLAGALSYHLPTKPLLPSYISYGSTGIRSVSMKSNVPITGDSLVRSLFVRSPVPSGKSRLSFMATAKEGSLKSCR